MRIGRGLDRCKSHSGSSAFLTANPGLDTTSYETILSVSLLRDHVLKARGQVYTSLLCQMYRAMISLARLFEECR